MNDFVKLISCSDDDLQFAIETVSEFRFFDSQIDTFGFAPQQTLELIVFEILTKPTALIAHLQRIYFCYQHNLQDPLFAALVDFLIVLEGKGHSLGRRMVNGAKSKLQPWQYAILNNALKAVSDEVKWLQGNMYSLFSRGLIGTNILVIKEENKTQQEYDPLDIARDFIAYSQLEPAMDTLENAILLDIERHELHDDLLELYKVTHSLERFIKMYDALLGQTKTMPVGWNELKGFFNAG
jgi:hypothetical protein